jgi:hypothetical protein
MNGVLVLFIVGVIIYFFLKDRHKMLENQVDSYGGMRAKYAELIEWLISDTNAQIIKVKRDHIQIRNRMRATETQFLITETFSGVEIEWRARLGIIGNHNKIWRFNKNTSNQQIIETIAFDMENFEKKYL